jgi:hypothetical protein
MTKIAQPAVNDHYAKMLSRLSNPRTGITEKKDPFPNIEFKDVSVKPIEVSIHDLRSQKSQTMKKTLVK